MNSNRMIVVFILSVLMAVVLQAGVIPIFFDPIFRPDFLLIVMIYFALRCTFQSGVPIAWSLGLIKDVFSGLNLGLNAFMFLLIFLAIKSVADRLYAESNLLFVLTVTVATLFSLFGTFLLLLIFSQSSGVFSAMIFSLLPHLLANAFVASLLGLLPRFDMDGEPV